MKIWTTKETDTLDEMVKAGKPYSEIAIALNRSLASVEKRAGRLGLRGNYIWWTKAEDEILSHQLTNGTLVEDMPQFLPGRSVAAIDARGYRLGLKFHRWKMARKRALKARLSEEQLWYRSIKQQDAKFKKAMLAAIKSGQERAVFVGAKHVD